MCGDHSGHLSENICPIHTAPHFYLTNIHVYSSVNRSWRQVKLGRDSGTVNKQHVLGPHLVPHLHAAQF